MTRARKQIRRLKNVRSTRGYGVWAMRHGISVTEHRAFGPVNDVHSEGSLHYQDDKKGNFAPDKQGNLAADVNDNDIADSVLLRIRRGHWKFWKPQSETETLRWLYQQTHKIARNRAWPLDEMFFDGLGFRMETGYDVNAPIRDHETHFHIGWTTSTW